MAELDYGIALAEGTARHGRLCVGVDPHPELLEQWGLDDSAGGARRFGLAVVAAASGRVAVVKPQLAFFERFGSAGIAALEEVIGAARGAGLLIIADAKRGDIGSTLAAYGQGWLEPGSPLECDALTLNSYQGVGSAAAVIEQARAWGKGLYFLAATSNTESWALQSARLPNGATVAADVIREVRALEDREHPRFGVVVGATAPWERLGLDEELLAGLPILAPGFGRQGAVLSGLDARFGTAGAGVLAVAARSIAEAGADALVERIEAHRVELDGADHPDAQPGGPA